MTFENRLKVPTFTDEVNICSPLVILYEKIAEINN